MTITEAYEKIKNSPELKKKAAEAAKNGKIEEFLKENGFDVTVDQIKDFVASAKKGYGEVLEKAMMNKLIKENKMVFCEVVDGNEISMHLQAKLGYVKGDKKIYWLV